MIQGKRKRTGPGERLPKRREREKLKRERRERERRGGGLVERIHLQREDVRPGTGQAQGREEEEGQEERGLPEYMERAHLHQSELVNRNKQNKKGLFDHLPPLFLSFQRA